MLEIAAMAATDVRMLRQVDALADAMARTGELFLVSRRSGRNVPGRTHERFQQYHRGVPVQGGGVTRQLADGVTVSIFGTIHQVPDIDVAPRISADEALAQLEVRSGAGPAEAPELIIAPMPLDAYVLAWRVTMRDRRTYFLDAGGGGILFSERAVHEADVGAGEGFRGNRKKMSVSQSGGIYLAHDRLRPAEIVTLDLRDDEDRAFRMIDYGESWGLNDVASDADNDWNDPHVVDAHVHAGFTYDYFALRQDWNALDGKNGRVVMMTNIGWGGNAFFAPPPFGPGGVGVAAFGSGFAVLDIVAHELMHGITHFSAGLLNTITAVHGPARFTVDGETFDCAESAYRPPFGGYVCDEGRFLLFANEGGAINEAFSDIAGAAVEFDVLDGANGWSLTPDYDLGEDSGPIIRSAQDPRSLTVGPPGTPPYPDAVGREIRFLQWRQRQEIYWTHVAFADGQPFTLDFPGYDGVHWNSTILSHAFYLAIEGGSNITTGRPVRGVGGANRLGVERAFFRAMTDLMPPGATFEIAAAAIRQSARDVGPEVFRAVNQALFAVGL